MCTALLQAAFDDALSLANRLKEQNQALEDELNALKAQLSKMSSSKELTDALVHPQTHALYSSASLNSLHARTACAYNQHTHVSNTVLPHLAVCLNPITASQNSVVA